MRDVTRLSSELTRPWPQVEGWLNLGEGLDESKDILGEVKTF